VKLGVFTVVFGQKLFPDALDYIKSVGLDAVEIGTGNYPGTAHCNPDELLGNPDKLKRFKYEVESRGLMISALSCHGNPLHPNKDVAKESHDVFAKTVLLAEQLEVSTVVGFSGCPGDHDGAKYPNWPVTAWPPDYLEVFDWQWREKVIPYWKETGKFASEHNVKIALEMHGGFSVHTPATLLKLREAVGEVIGANLDPSHMWWQGIDPVQAIKVLGKEGAIHYFHAKDTAIDPVNVNTYGLTDMQHYGNLMTRSWNFRTVGFGHDLKTWADMISALRLVGYDYVVSMEHEDALMSPEEGFEKGAANLKQIILREPVGEMWWA